MRPEAGTDDGDRAERAHRRQDPLSGGQVVGPRYSSPATRSSVWLQGSLNHSSGPITPGTAPVSAHTVPGSAKAPPPSSVPARSAEGTAAEASMVAPPAMTAVVSNPRRRAAVPPMSARSRPEHRRRGRRPVPAARHRAAGRLGPGGHQRRHRQGGTDGGSEGVRVGSSLRGQTGGRQP